MDDLDRLLAFEMGADDYLTKPCSTIECLARLRAMLNRAYVKKNTRASITEETIHLDCAKRIAYRANEQLPLTNTEFNILEMLIKFPGQAFSKEELTEYALGRKHTAYDRSIDVHISNLRHKLGLNLNQEPWIKTVRGFGYLFNAPQK
jgi:two-component system response regulator CpxR